jgi:hypothetical protein
MAPRRQRHPWSRASHSCLAPDQLSVWLPLDRQQPGGVSSALARPREPGGPSNNKFLGSLSLLCRCGLVAHVTHHHSLLTLWGAHLYFWARLGYLLAAAAGYGLLRSVLFWNTALTGIALFLIALVW